MRIGLQTFEGLELGETVYFTRMRKPPIRGKGTVIALRPLSWDRSGQPLPRIAVEGGAEHIALKPCELTRTKPKGRL